MGFEKLNAGVSKPLVRDVGEKLGLSPEHYT
jgi:hypothetical protein